MGGDSEEIEITLLGETRLIVDGHRIPLRSLRQRAVLAALALECGRPVSADVLLERVWGHDLPATGVKAVAHPISRLRTHFGGGAANVVTHSPAGYTLEIEADHVDVHRFARLVDEARACLPADPARAEHLVRRSFDLWQGPPFVDLPAGSHDDERQRLERLRLLGRRTLAEAMIAEGRVHDALLDLTALTEEHPLEESFVELSMRALTRAGRAADALRAYGTYRRTAATELGIEPSKQLQQLEGEILRGSLPHSPSPGAPAPQGGVGRIHAPVSNLVGRKRQIADVDALLTESRLVTICGFGGLGKTRLAIEVARLCEDRHDVAFVDLTAAADADSVPSTFLTEIGVGRDGLADPLEHLVRHVSGRNCLIVADNCEHVVDEVGDLLEQLLSRVGDLRVLATSRRPLRRAGEIVWHVPPLDQDEAEALFIARATAARPGVELHGEENERLGEAILHRLAGVPLAIELTASRLRALSLDQLAAQLEHGYELVSRGGPAIGDRQRSLSSVLAWSIGLLTRHERAVLAAVSTSAGGCTFDATRTIGGAIDPQLTPAAAADALCELVDTGLIEHIAATDRYHRLEPVRDHFLDEMSPAARHELERTHAMHHLRVARSFLQLDSTDRVALVELGDAEMPNLRKAVAWALREDERPIARDLLVAMMPYINERMLLRDFLRWSRVLLFDPDDVDGSGLMELAAHTLVAATNVGDTDTAAMARRIVRRDTTGLPPRLRARLATARAVDEMNVDPVAAVRVFHEAAALTGFDDRGVIVSVNNIAQASWLAGRFDVSDELWEAFCAVADRLDPADTRVAGIMACRSARHGRWDDVLAACAVADGADDGSRFRVSLARAEALAATGDLEAADVEWRWSEAVLDRVDPDRDPTLVHTGHHVKASIDLLAGRSDAALRRLVSTGRNLGRTTHLRAAGAHHAALLAIAFHDVGAFERSALLAGYAEAEMGALGTSLRSCDAHLFGHRRRRLESELGRTRVARLMTDGRGCEWLDLPISEPDDPDR